MKLTAPALLLFILVPSLPRSSSARIVNQPSPEELANKSTLVCNGTPTEIATNGETSLKPHSAFNLQTLGYWAKIKVLKVLKGDPMVSTITLHYFHLAPGVEIGNGPIEICLETGKRYRFYLRQEKDSTTYAPCLMGDFDDGPSVEAFTVKQTDDSKPLTKTEAVKMAEDYLKIKHPEIDFDPIVTTAWYFNDGCWDSRTTSPPCWRLVFWQRVSSNPPPRNDLGRMSGGAVADVSILGDGEIIFQCPN